MNPDRCWSPIGEPLILERSGGRRRKINLFCGLNYKFEPIAPYLTEENCRADNFENWFELQFLPKLPSNAVIVIDNARFHRKDILFDLIKRYNLWFDTQLSIIFLPPYSPDYNPIENFFAVTKGKVKRLGDGNRSVEERLIDILKI
jgi:transposase